MDARTDKPTQMDVWYEYEEPYLFNNGTTRWFYRNDKLNLSIFIQEVFRFPKHEMQACIDYRNPNTGLLHLIEPEVLEEFTYPDDVVTIQSLKEIPEDKELIALFDDGRKMKNILFDMYGMAVIFTKVKDKKQAFEIAELMAKRQQGDNLQRGSGF